MPVHTLVQGIMALGMTMLLFLIRFPMWGGMLPSSLVPGHKQQPGEACEEAYYSADFTAAERRLGMHTSVLRFVSPAAPAPAPSDLCAAAIPLPSACLAAGLATSRVQPSVALPACVPLCS